MHTYCDIGDSDRTLLLLHGFSFRQGMYPLMEDASNRSKSLLPFKEDQFNPVVLSKFLGQLIQVEIESEMKSVPTRTLAIWGEQDTFILSKWGAQLDQFLSDSEYMEMAGEYHNIATIKPNSLAHIISGFVT